MLGTLINAFVPRTRAATIQSLGHPSAGVIDWFDPSGATVTPVSQQTALTIAAWWCGVRILSETMASMPCILYRRTSNDSRERAKEDHRYFLMHDEPHPEITPFSFFDSGTANLVMRGNCYSKITFRQNMEVAFMEPRMPDKVCVEIDGATKRFEVTDPKETIPSERMLHVLGLSNDGIKGWDVISYAANTLAGAMAAERRATSQTQNNAMPSGALIHPMRLNKEAREQYRREWDEIHSGDKNAGKIAILHGGQDFKPFSFTNEQMQFLESRTFSLRDIARFLRVPLHMLYDLENSSVRANIEQAAIEFLIYSMLPWKNRWQQALNKKLLSRDERNSLYFDFLWDAFLQGDTKSRFEAHAIARQWGFESVNDILRMENRNTIGPEGDIYLQPSNMVPAGTTPAAITNDLQGNLAKSLAAIVDSGKRLREDMATMFVQPIDALNEANERVTSAVSGLRDDRELIRKDIAELGKVQVQGVDMNSLSNGHEAITLFRSKLACLVKIEKAEVIKAAHRQASRGESFIKWMDNWYAAYPWDKQGLDGKFCTAWVEESKRLLLEACDGEAAGFVDRVQEALNLFAFRVNEAKP